MASAIGKASSSPFLPPRSWTYHVFLSFGEQDTRKGFTDHIYTSLQKKGITGFRDDMNLERGQVIAHASSAWCLDELAPKYS
ncbi:hypothetical protein HN51_067333 [Arachis hypogaea]|uniref:ADP-ribosyl cyclase/cyclic ADP-ribose hydrolase n=1 Tax=Arachis hypogaea TaxID=3818 RepID=A0A444ZMM1_ARAHY|nr:hypothetical protein Ahy_B04g072197 [Arachis hypogaea]